MAITTERDEVAFERLVEPHKRGLHAHCYRMLGSLHDAEDAHQEALLRAWLEPYPDGELESGYAAPEARYEQREAVELAFVAALQHLPAQQRAALILRDVLGFSAREAAGALDTSVAAVNSALQRARRSASERLPERSQQATIRALGDEPSRAILHGFVDAWERNDVPAMVALLAEDVIYEMPPWAAWWQGRETIAALHGNPSCMSDWRWLPVRANGQLGFAAYGLDGNRHRAVSINVMTLRGDRIAISTGFVNAALFPRFGLPEAL